MRYQEFLKEVLKKSCSPAEFQWVEEKLTKNLQARQLGFVMTPRFIRDRQAGNEILRIQETNYTIDMRRWTLDQIARSILLLSMDEGDPEKFHDTIETLFQTAENREAATIYKTIPLFDHPEMWIYRATEAIRTNIGTIFDAMAFHNPFPAMHFDDIAWNQLVLKTIFGDKSIWSITGLKERRNKELARAISDFAHERWSAHRTLPADVWYLVEPFPGEQMWNDTSHLLLSEDRSNQAAGYLLWASNQDMAPDRFWNQHKNRLEEAAQHRTGWKELQRMNKKES